MGFWRRSLTYIIGIALLVMGVHCGWELSHGHNKDMYCKCVSVIQVSWKEFWPIRVVEKGRGDRACTKPMRGESSKNGPCSQWQLWEMCRWVDAGKKHWYWMWWCCLGRAGLFHACTMPAAFFLSGNGSLDLCACAHALVFSSCPEKILTLENTLK